MAAITQDQILDAIANMTVLEASELVKAMEEKFGVTAAVAVAAGPGIVRTRSAATQGLRHLLWLLNTDRLCSTLTHKSWRLSSQNGGSLPSSS